MYDSIILNNVLLFISVFVAIYYKSYTINNVKWFVGYLFFIGLLEASVNILIVGFGFKDASFAYPFYVAFEFFFISNFLVRTF